MYQAKAVTPHGDVAATDNNTTTTTDTSRSRRPQSNSITLLPESLFPNCKTANSTSKPGKIFQFVDVNPTTDAERSQNKILVRSNASNYHWQRAKKSTASNLSRSSPKDGKRSHVNETDVHKVVNRPRFDGPAVYQPRKNSHLSFDQSGITHEDQVKEESECKSNVSLVQVEPTNDVFGQQPSTRLDSFSIYLSDLPYEVVNSVFGRISDFFHAMFPPEGDNTSSTLAKTWLRTILNDRALFHGALLSQMTRDAVQLGRVEDSRESVQCYTETLRGVHRKFLENGDSRFDDENILTVYILAYHGNYRTKFVGEAPNQGPLQKLFMLDVYGGRLQTIEVHMQGLAKMISLRGGIHKIGLPGLGLSIAYGDIIMATQTLTKPLIPFVAMHQGLAVPLTAAFRQDHPLFGLGRGFCTLPGLLDQAQNFKLKLVLHGIVQYTFAIDDHVYHRPEAPIIIQLTQQRNFVQHALMLLTPSEEAVESEGLLHRLCRLGTVVYSLLVTFPIPPIAAPFHRLAKNIRVLLSNPKSEMLSTEIPSFVLWVLFMGAIASIGSRERSWYIASLTCLLGPMCISDWPTLKEHLTMYLWYGDTNDVDGFGVWREIVQAKSFCAGPGDRQR